MAHTLSAKKRIRQNLKKRLHNQQIKSSIKTQIKKVRLLLADYSQKGKDAPSDKNKKTLQAELSRIYKLLDKAASLKIIHKNKVARFKSRLTRAINKISK